MAEKPWIYGMSKQEAISLLFSNFQKKDAVWLKTAHLASLEVDANGLRFEGLEEVNVKK